MVALLAVKCCFFALVLSIAIRIEKNSGLVNNLQSKHNGGVELCVLILFQQYRLRHEISEDLHQFEGDTRIDAT